MRETIRRLLIAGVPEVEGRVYEPHAVRDDTAKPFLVEVVGRQDPGEPWAGYVTPVEVWVYGDRTHYEYIDQIGAEVIAALDEIRLDEAGQKYLTRYDGTVGEDAIDPDWEAIARGYRFEVFALPWLDDKTYEPDPVSMLQAWTAARWPEVQTDPDTWSPSEATPGIYWRLDSILYPPAGAYAGAQSWGAWVDGVLRGHVVAQHPAERREWARRVAEALAAERYLKLSDGSPFFFQGSTLLDNDQDPMRIGQIQIVGRYGVLSDAYTARFGGPSLNVATIEPSPSTGEAREVAAVVAERPRADAGRMVEVLAGVDLVDTDGSSTYEQSSVS